MSPALALISTPAPQPRLKPQDILQDQLAALWEQVFAVPRVGINDTLASLGGTPAQAARLIALVEGMYGVRPAVAALSGSATVQTLSDGVFATLPIADVITVQAGDAARRPPLFFLHGDFSGGGFYVRVLARELGCDQPVVVLQHHGMHGEEIPETIEALAEDMRQRLQRCWPSGPFFLGGHCAGGLIAFEMARQLGRTSRLRSVVLVEPPLARIGRTIPPPLPRLPERMHDLRYRRAYVFTQYATRAVSYQPDWYPGAIGVFLAQDAARRDAESRATVRALASDVDVHVIRGNHITVLGRHVSDLGAAMRGFLDRSCRPASN